MMRKLSLIFYIPLLLAGCSINKDSDDFSHQESSFSDASIESDEEDSNMKLFIDNQSVPVTWENNESVLALNNLTPLKISMSRDGGFEQVGSIGENIVSDDSRISTSPGDIVLYNSNNLVIFFGTNTWSYTKIGHINLSSKELTDLLDVPSVDVEIKPSDN